MKRFTRLIALLGFPLMTACLHSSPLPRPDEGHWRLVETGTLSDPAAVFSIEFSDAPGSVTGDIACNRWKGTLVTGDGFRIEGASSTRKRCQFKTAGESEMERQFLIRLTEGASSTREGEDWILTFADGTRWRLRPK